MRMMKMHRRKAPPRRGEGAGTIGLPLRYESFDAILRFYAVFALWELDAPSFFVDPVIVYYE